MSHPSPLTFVRVNGADAAVFLNGQFTQSALDMTPGETRIGAFCTPKGRTVAVAWLHRSDDAFELWAARDVLDALVTGLRRYVMRAKVVFDPVDEPTATRAVTLNDGKIALDLGAGSYTADAVRAGVPTVHGPTVEQFVPQMLNLDLLGGVDFAKGCYTGQEIVARMHNLGTIKRRMLAFECAEAAALQPGDDLVDASGGKVGQVVSAASDTVLAVVRLAALAEKLVAGESAVPVGAVLELPYSIPEYEALSQR